MAPVDYSVRILADSVNPVGDRLTTFELTYPRFVHADLMTHRLFSRNAASSRAIPTRRLRERVREFPASPKWWGRNQKGMQAQYELQGQDLEAAKREWLLARRMALYAHERLEKLGLHKQIANRVLEPWMFITVIVSATEYENWLALRDTWPEGQPPGPAQPEIAWVAREMHKRLDESVPWNCAPGDLHLPLISFDRGSPLYVPPELDDDTIVKIAVARCARVSYLTHEGTRDFEKDVELHDRLAAAGHWSCFEHVARAMRVSRRSGNFVGWQQYRKGFENEHRGRSLPE